MSQSETSHKLADQLVDTGYFREAILLYKKLLMSGDIDASALVNLVIVHPLEMLQFSKDLLEIHPDSKIILQHHIIVLIHNNLGQQAMELCVEALRDANLSEGQRIQFVSHRFRASLQAGIIDYIKDDFIAIWQSLHNAKGKQKLLQDILSVADSSLEDVFLKLSSEGIFTNAMRQVFAEKARVLAQLGHLTEEDFV